MNLINFVWLLAFSFLLVCISILYLIMRNYLSNIPSGSQSLYHNLARNTLSFHQITGTIYCITAISSRFDFVSDFLSLNMVVNVSVSILYEFSYITSSISLGCLAIIRLLCLVNISLMEETVGEFACCLIHGTVSSLIGIQKNSVITNSVVNELSVITNSVVNELSVITNSVVNELSVITNRFLGLIGHFTTQINLVITNPGYNEQKWPVPSCSL